MTQHKSTWLITAKTNLHVGDESSTGYGLIDKSIQREPLMGLPCINSSSLKGALNEFCCHNTELEANERINIFGSDKKTKTSDSRKGGALFFDASILFIPVQDDIELYKFAYSPKVLEKFLNLVKLFDPESGLSSNVLIRQVEQYSGKSTRECSSNEFKKICDDDSLPIIARNVLDNGESRNLWYEQVLPSETILGTFIQSTDDTLEKVICDKIVQIGANATIGYGYCQFTKL